MGGIALFLVLILSTGITLFMLVLGEAAGIALHPFWTFLVVFILLTLLTRKL